MNEKGLLMIISGPSGAGKGTVVEELKKDPKYALSISATTREPRPHEENGVHYFFKTKDEFEKMIDNKKLLEYAEIIMVRLLTMLKNRLNKIKQLSLK